MHQSSRGAIGTLNSQGRQIGGFLDWEIETVTYPVNKSTFRASKLSLWKARASSFWLLERLSGPVADAIFYCYNGRELRQVSQNTVRLKLPSDYPLNREVHQILELTLG